MKENKDTLTYEDLTDLCKKQEEYIKELEEELRTPSKIEKCDELAKPDYEELCRQVDYLNHQLNALIDENNALRWSLTTSHKEVNDWKNRSEMWEENYYKEHKRAEKLYDEWAVLKENIKE